MVRSTLLSLALAYAVAAATIERRQSEGKGPTGLFSGLPGSPPPNVTAAKVETLKPTFPGDDVKRVKLTYGPYKLKAANSTTRIGNYISQDPQGTAWMSHPSDFPTDITILSVHLVTHLADGTPISNANGVYNHHVFVVDSSKAPVAHIACAGTPLPIMPINSIMGNSEEAMSELASGGVNPTTRPVTGNYVGRGHVMTIQLDLVNYNNRSEEVYVSMDMSYVNGREKGIWEIAQHLVPVGICAAVNGGGMAAVTPPEGKKKWTLSDDGFVMQDTGKLLYLRGHMHDGSVNMVFSLNGKQICDSRTEYNGADAGEAAQAATQPGGHLHGDMKGGAMSGISICMNGTEYKKGDKLSISATYDLDLHPLRKHPGGSMGGAANETMSLGVIATGTQL